MIGIAPFKALRPAPGLASRICELPYDVMSSGEAREIAQDNPLSFLHVSKPEIDLPAGTDIYSQKVYSKGKENFDRLISQGALRQDSAACYYLYRQVMGAHSQCGLVAAASCEDYLGNAIKKHEYTRLDKEDDRVRHIEALGAQTGPVFLVHEARKSIREHVMRLTEQPPVVDFVAADQVRHSAWVISDPGDIELITHEFASMPALYIADGHHRCAAAARVYRNRNGAGASARFLSVIFPHDQVRILAYNRVLTGLNGLSPERLIEKLGIVFDFVGEGVSTPSQKCEVGFYIGGKWRLLRFKRELAGNGSVLDRLDVELLQKHVLAPFFGIDDPRKSERIWFVGGIRGVGELERLVDSGSGSCAFSMFPTGIRELMEIADAGGIMPPKSTWFEPKLRDAMFCHLL